jgi:two-component system sensor histidine kinase TctE
MSALIAEKNIDFELVASPCPVLAHEWMLRELARNLLHNAIRHTPEHGQLNVHIAAEGDMAKLIIADSGQGIPDSLHQRLFQPFATANSRSGTGLGLTIAREIVVSLGGSVQLTNRMLNGQITGLDAIVRLPLAVSSEA